jgi:hypothetical protein
VSASAAKGRAFEREFAATIGARRTPGSGRSGGGDVTPRAGDVWADWSWELKRRARLPALVTEALEQAAADVVIGDRRRPAMAMRADHGQTIVAFYWEDLRTWAEALAEVGRSGEVRRLAAQIESAARQIREVAK